MSEMIMNLIDPVLDSSQFGEEITLSKKFPQSISMHTSQGEYVSENS